MKPKHPRPICPSCGSVKCKPVIRNAECLNCGHVAKRGAFVSYLKGHSTGRRIDKRPSLSKLDGDNS